jgi:hypothetical protein
MEKYYVFLVRHEHGDYKVNTFDQKSKLKKYLLQYLKKYEKYSKELNENTLFEIVNEAEKVGNIVIEEEEGYGIVKVVFGNEIDSDDEDRSSSSDDDDNSSSSSDDDGSSSSSSSEDDSSSSSDDDSSSSSSSSEDDGSSSSEDNGSSSSEDDGSSSSEDDGSSSSDE